MWESFVVDGCLTVHFQLSHCNDEQSDWSMTSGKGAVVVEIGQRILYRLCLCFKHASPLRLVMVTGWQSGACVNCCSGKWALQGGRCPPVRIGE